MAFQNNSYGLGAFRSVGATLLRGATDAEIQALWQKATYVSEANEQRGYRKDACGAWIRRDEYGNRSSKFGWERDHIVPIVLGGGDEISNLQPLHWRNNAAKSDGRLVRAVWAEGDHNVEVAGILGHRPI